MSISLNHLTIAGNLTRDPQIRFLANERCVASFGIANSRRYKSGNETKEETLFLDCEAWGQTGEHIGKYFVKGKPIIVEGRLRMDTWADKESGKPRSKPVLVVDRFHFVPDGKGKPEGAAAAGDAAATPAPSAATPPSSAPAAPAASDDEPPF